VGNVCLQVPSVQFQMYCHLSRKCLDQYAQIYTLCSKKVTPKFKITITTAHLNRINYPLSSFNYRLSGTNSANFNKIRHIVSEQQLLKNGTQKQNFPIWKIPITILTAESVTNDIILETFL